MIEYDNTNGNNENLEMEIDKIQCGVDDIVVLKEGLRVQFEKKPSQSNFSNFYVFLLICYSLHIISPLFTSFTVTANTS